MSAIIIGSDPKIIIGGYDVTGYVESPISITQRLDEVLDSASFSIVYEYKSGNNPTIQIAPKPAVEVLMSTIEPFTLCSIEGNYAYNYYYASSECQKVITTTNEAYIHKVTLYELTKRLETFILGSKAFSIIQGKSNYNTDYDRIRIINELMADKYNFAITLDSSMSSRFTLNREYSFGAGTTMFDALKEIMANENCIPRLEYDGDNYILTFDDLNLVGESQTLNNIESITITQNVDEYCSEIETELSEVSGSTSPSTIVLAATGVDDVVTGDNACLVLPTKIDTVTQLEIVGKNLLIATNDWFVTYNCELTDDQIKTINNNSNVLNVTTLHSVMEQVLGTVVADSFYNNSIPNKGYSKQAGFVIGAIGYSQVVVGGKYATYNESKTEETTPNLEFTRTGDNSVDITNYLLNKEQYDLLEAKMQPKYLYYEHGTNIIGGFNQRANDTFWMSMIYGKVTSFMTAMFVDNTGHFAKTASGNGSALPLVFRVNYYPLAPLFTRVEKDLIPNNISSRSFNNGSSSIDFNQLMPQMEKSVNLLGLEVRTITCRCNVPIGSKTQYGYVISKTLNYRIYNDQVLDSITYICSDNKQLVAQAVSRATQYEATNLPQTGIIDRYVYFDTNKSISSYSTPYLLICDENYGEDIVAKPIVCLTNGKYKYGIVEAEDNYSIGTRLVKSDQTGYYANTPVKYADNDNYRETYRFYVLDPNLNYDTVSNIEDSRIDFFASLPYYPKTSDTIHSTYGKYTALSNKLVYKDPRERLIFVIRFK